MATLHDPEPIELSEHDRRNRECALRLEAQLVKRERSLLVVSLEPGLHQSRRTGIVLNIGTLPGVELVADGSALPLETLQQLLHVARDGTAP